jgi:hypothetical protein
MKRNIVLALVAALTISLVATSAAFAMGYGPGGNGTNMEVTLSNYMPTAMADVLGLSVDEINTRLASGETFATIALSLGYTTDQLPALMTSVRSEAINLAIADGVLTADQAAFLLNSQYGGNTRGNGAGTASMNNASNGTGLCDGTCIPQNLSQTTGGSMMRRGGRH